MNNIRTPLKNKSECTKYLPYNNFFWRLIFLKVDRRDGCLAINELQYSCRFCKQQTWDKRTCVTACLVCRRKNRESCEFSLLPLYFLLAGPNLFGFFLFPIFFLYSRTSNIVRFPPQTRPPIGVSPQLWVYATLEGMVLTWSGKGYGKLNARRSLLAHAENLRWLASMFGQISGRLSVERRKVVHLLKIALWKSLNLRKHKELNTYNLYHF